MRYENGQFSTEHINELMAFGNFLGGLEFLSLDHEIKDAKGNILVQAKRPLRSSILKALSTRSEQQWQFYLHNSDNFKASLTGKLIKEINARMNLAGFSFASYLLNRQRINITRIVTAAMKNEFFVGFVTLLLLKQKPIMEHLFEVALTSLGILANYKKEELQTSEMARIFQAGMLHDFTISESVYWEKDEEFQEEPDHDKKSAEAISDKNLDPSVPDIVSTSNQLKNNYLNATRDDSWNYSMSELSAVILNLVEYYTFACRLVAEQNVEDETARVMYLISLQAEKGYFPKPLIAIYEQFFDKYAEFFKYGEAIGAIENLCPHGPYALAYPKPKSTQVLCKNSEVPCIHRIAGKPLNVVNADNDFNRFGEQLYPGWYEKCRFSEKLPEPPKIL